MSFKPSEIGIAVITYYPRWYQGSLRSIKHTSKIRGDLALQFFKKTSEAGYRLVVVDGKSSKTFRQEVKTIPNIKVINRRSDKSGASKRQAIKTVAAIPGVKVIIITEAEKTSLVDDCLPHVVAPILKGEADIVVPKRNERLFKSSYPEYMYNSEREGNDIYNEALRSNGILPEGTENLDMFFGPRAFRNEKKLLFIFNRRYRLEGQSILGKLYDPESYSNVQFFPIINALRKKLRVKTVEVPFMYPKIQKENEEVGARSEFELKRKLQRMGLLVDLMHFLSYINRKRQSGIRSLT